MSNANVAKTSRSAGEPSVLSRLTQSIFFRQSGWMLFATTLSGVFFYATHVPASRFMDPDEYGVYNTLLQVLNQMAIPAVGLMTIFVQQAAMSETEEHRRELAGAVRSVIKATFLFWLTVVVASFVFQEKLLADYKVRNPLALWATVVLGLISLWAPVMQGILQGRQSFLWLGMIPIVSAFTRLVFVTLIVIMLASALFSSGHIKDPAKLAERIVAASDPVSRFLWGQFNAEEQRAIGDLQTVSIKREEVLSHGLNRILGGPSVFAADRFAGVRLSKESRLRLTQSLRGEKLMRLNRLLLEDAYPQEIERRSGEAILFETDVKDVPGLAKKLSTKTGAVSGSLWKFFIAPVQRVLENPQSSPDQLRHALTGELNRLLKGPSLFVADGFEDVPLSQQTRLMLTPPPAGEDLVRLNRRLLEDVYPVEIGGNPLRARQAAGAITGVLVSMILSLGVGIWQTLPLWRGEASKFHWKPWLKRVLPLTLGMGSTTFMFTIDMLAVQRFLEDSGIYGAAGMIGRALVFMVAPLTTVMFPKIVRAAAKSERTNVMAQALGATALMAGGAALFCTFFPDLPIRIVQGEKYLAAAPLVRWFAWCVLPLMVSTVLVNNLMARERYEVVPWLVAVASLYALALWQPAFHASHTRVIQTLGGFAVIYFAVCVFFTWRKKPASASAPASQTEPLPPAV